MPLAVSGHNSVWRNRGTPDMVGRPGTSSAWPLAPGGEPRCVRQLSGLKQTLCSPKTGSKAIRLCRGWLNPAAIICLVCLSRYNWWPYWNQEESVGVKQGMPLHFYCLPVTTFLSPNPSFTQSLLQYPLNSFVILWLSFQPFQWFLSLKMESGLFPLWGAGRGRNLWTAYSPALFCGMPPVLGKRWENAR